MLDNFEELPPDLPAPKPPGHGRLVAAGVVGAVALGVGMGLWARPAPPEPPHPRTMAPEDAPRPALQIIVDDSPAPFGPLLEVLPGEAAPDRGVAPPPYAPDMVAPRRPAAGLMKVDAVVAAEPLLVPTVKVEPRPKAEPRPRPEPRIEKAPEKPKVQKAKAEPKPMPRPEKLKVAVAGPAKAEKAQIEKAKVEKAKVTGESRLAKAEKARAERLAKAEKVERAKAEKARAAKLAQAEAKAQKAAKAKAETKRLASLVKAVKATPKKLKAEVVKPKTQLAKARSAKAPKVEKASTRPVVARPAAKKPPAAKPAPRRPAPVGEGPMRVARNEGCASSDPGAAVVCADRRLGARDRQLQQAYRNAEAAGVPSSSLQRQQARWLQARAAAAREAPWAVEDVYEARISELNDLTRDAREN